jgi:hypothetical protein
MKKYWGVVPHPPLPAFYRRGGSPLPGRDNISYLLIFDIAAVFPAHAGSSLRNTTDTLAQKCTLLTNEKGGGGYHPPTQKFSGGGVPPQSSGHNDKKNT